MPTWLWVALLGGGGLLYWNSTRPAKDRVSVGDTVYIGYTTTGSRVETRLRVTNVTPTEVSGTLLDYGNVPLTISREQILRFA